MAMLFERGRVWWRRWQWDIAVCSILLLVAGIPRLLDSGLFLTADEKNWMGRSYEFIRAFKDLRFNDMLQTTHPGVTTLWLVGISLTLKMFVSHVPFTFNQLAHFASAAQLPIALVTTTLIPLMYLLLRVVLSVPLAPLRLPWVIRLVPFVATLFIALDPFLIGYSRVAHVDALLAYFLFLAMLATIRYRQQRYDRTWLIVSAVLSSLALLTKAPAIFMVPFLGLVILSDRARWNRSFWYERSRDVVTWLLLVTLIFLLAWPALLWVPDQQGNVLVLKRDLVEATITPHHMVEDYTLNAWHYPAALLVRTSPLSLSLAVMAILGLVLALLPQARLSRLAPFRAGTSTYWLILSYIFFFVLMMTLGAKKGDRYILPVWPAIDVLAALGLMISVGIITRWRRSMTLAFVLVALVSTGYLAVTVVRYHPYNLAYSNPLFPDNLSQELGWGEGLEQVAAWLNQTAPNARVASWYPEELQAFTSARVSHINAHAQPSMQYVVMYRNMFGRAPDHYANDFIDEYYRKREPVFIARVAGKEFAWVYATRAYETVTPELIPPLVVEQTVVAEHEGLRIVEFMAATHQGRADQGELIARVTNPETGELYGEARFMIADVEDNSWLKVSLNASPVIGEQLVIAITATGTAPQRAPVIRLTRQADYREGDVRYTPSPEVSPRGDLAIRLRYHRGTADVSEEETLLLTAPAP